MARNDGEGSNERLKFKVNVEVKGEFWSEG